MTVLCSTYRNGTALTRKEQRGGALSLHHRHTDTSVPSQFGTGGGRGAAVLLLKRTDVKVVLENKPTSPADRIKATIWVRFMSDLGSCPIISIINFGHPLIFGVKINIVIKRHYLTGLK